MAKHHCSDAVSPERTGTAIYVMDNNSIYVDKEEIIGFDALYDSMMKSKKGVTWKGSVAHYVLNSMEETYKLCEELEKGTYKARPTTQFTITSPKPREIISVCFRDRVYQRSLNDNALYPIMTRQLIRDNWACQKGKGTDDARDRMKVFLQRMYRKYGTDFVNACLLLVLQIIDFNKISLSNHSIKIDRGQSIRMELVIVLSAMKKAS